MQIRGLFLSGYQLDVLPGLSKVKSRNPIDALTGQSGSTLQH